MLRILKSRPAQSIMPTMVLLVTVAAIAAAAAPARATPLDDYVAIPDPSYSWSVADKSSLPGSVTCISSTSLHRRGKGSSGNTVFRWPCPQASRSAGQS